MGNIESNDKVRDMSVPDHIAQTFKQSAYSTEGMEVSNTNHDRYGPCQLIEATYDKVIVKKRLKIKDDRQYQLFQKNKQHRLSFDQNVFVKLVDFEAGSLTGEETEDDMYKYYIDSYFEHHNNDLAQEIGNRRSGDIYFSAAELEQLMDMFIRAGTTLNDLGSRHSDLRPEFVCIDDSTGKFLLMENLRDKTGAGSRLAFVAEIDLYLSPILFKSYSKNIIKYKHDKSKDDVFSAGMIILEAGLLDSVQSCYDRDTGKFRLENLAELMERFEQHYGGNHKLCQRLRSFLVFDETDRSAFQELSKQSGIVVTKQQSNPTTSYSGGYSQPKPIYSNGGGSTQQHQPLAPTYSNPSNNYQASNLGYGLPQQQQPQVYGRSPLQTQPQTQSSLYDNSRFSNPQPQPPNRFQGNSNPLASRLGNY